MSTRLTTSSAAAMALSFLFTVSTADSSGAVAQTRKLPAPDPQSTVQVSVPAPAATDGPEILLPAADPSPAVPAAPAPDDAVTPAPARGDADTASLAQRVAARSIPAELPRELECLAGAVYFEAKGESLEGQLAVGRVVVNRARSGRFPNSYCGVVYQRAQFSFIQGNAMPAIKRSSRDWKEAVAIAQIAADGSWTNSAEGALFFHAARVSPRWRLTRVARIENHVFYR